MPEDTKQPGSTEPSNPETTESDSSDKSITSAASNSDSEKASLVEAAKSKVAAAKETLAAQPAAPKPPVKKKEEGPKPTDASAHPLVKKLKDKFGESIGEAVEFLRQVSVSVKPDNIVEICEFLKNDQSVPFDYLSDLTCVHFPERGTVPFEVVYNLYSIPANERIRLKARTSASQGIHSVTSVWPSANWLEREVFDLFGVHFTGHPDLRRLLLPPDWEGYPLRKDYPLEFVENAWTEKHLPEMTEVQMEQLEQRRAYGLELLSIPQERLMREIFRGGKEVMTKDK